MRVTSQTRGGTVTSTSSIRAWIISARFATLSRFREPLRRNQRRLCGWGIPRPDCTLLIRQEQTTQPGATRERRGRESNPRIEVLQTPTLPLGYPAEIAPRSVGARLGGVNAAGLIQMSSNERRQRSGMFLLAISGISHVGQPRPRLAPASLLLGARLATGPLFAAHNSYKIDATAEKNRKKL
jgi:hypothetical protein